MAKTKREYILATCFLSGAAAIISFVALGTEEWITSKTTFKGDQGQEKLKFGLFNGVFRQYQGVDSTIGLTMTCSFEKNICALMCGDNMSKNLERLYNNEPIPTEDSDKCAVITSDVKRYYYYSRFFTRTDLEATQDRTFINMGIWVSTIFFLCFSAVMGLISAGLAVWNTAANPYQEYLSIFGMYIYNAVAFFSILLSIILWGAMYASLFIKNNIPLYKTFIEQYDTKGLAFLGYSYWINLASLFLYMASISVLYFRNYLISKEPEVKVHIEENTDPILYLY